jgi:hypothetical protein
MIKEAINKTLPNKIIQLFLKLQMLSNYIHVCKFHATNK